MGRPERASRRLLVCSVTHLLVAYCGVCQHAQTRELDEPSSDLIGFQHFHELPRSHLPDTCSYRPRRGVALAQLPCPPPRESLITLQSPAVSSLSTSSYLTPPPPLYAIVVFSRNIRLKQPPLKYQLHCTTNNSIVHLIWFEHVYTARHHCTSQLPSDTPLEQRCMFLVPPLSLSTRCSKIRAFRRSKKSCRKCADPPA